MADLTSHQIWWNVFLIQALAGGVGFISLRNAEHNGLINKGSCAPWQRWCLMSGVVVAIVLPWPLWWVFQGSGACVVRGAAIYDLPLLFFLLRYTGGPTQSWFTPFLLAFVPLVVQLEPDATIYWSLLYLVSPLLIFASQLDLAMLKGVPLLDGSTSTIPLEYKEDQIKTHIYHAWYFWCTVLTSFFPAMVGLRVIPQVQAWLGR